MKLFIKKHKLTLMVLLMLIILTAYFAIQYQKQYEKSVDTHYEVINYLKNNPDIDIKVEYPYMPDTYGVFDHLLIDTNFQLIVFILPFLMIVAGTYNFYKKLKSGYIKNEFMRKKYSRVIIKNIFFSWSTVIIIPIFLLFVFFCAYLISGHFNVNESLKHNDAIVIGREYLSNLPKYIFMYILNLTLLGIYFINIGILYAKKNFNFFVTIVLSYLTYFFSCIFLELILGVYLQKLFPNVIPYYWTNSLSLNNFWVYDSVISQEFMTGVALMLIFITSLILIYVYHNKEGVVIETEK